ncbi:hypothetical protein T11_8527 [Trichinella zimbabwensis]|uniref:Uncharacterized protein n=1 Tax=Trichinella zimbabwensis TaxID=268475 RepID=A0A0V1GJ10_9BILA|nr:hypothetical protein T11_8527 [Trichinella zimbabwensis]
MRRRRRQFYIGVVQGSWKNRTRLSDRQWTAKYPYDDGK